MPAIERPDPAFPAQRIDEQHLPAGAAGQGNEADRRRGGSRLLGLDPEDDSAGEPAFSKQLSKLAASVDTVEESGHGAPPAAGRANYNRYSMAKVLHSVLESLLLH